MSSSEGKKIIVEVAYALAHKQEILSLEVDDGCTMYDAMLQSNIKTKFPEIDYDQVELGIFGKIEKDPKAVALRAGDRVEIYRPLTADPKEVRKKRAAEAKANRTQS